MSAEVLQQRDPSSVCELCQNPYSTSIQRFPKLLSCFHTFCHSCLTSRIHESSIECPSCHITTPVPHSLLDNIGDDFTLEFTLGLSDSSQTFCSNCDDHPKPAVCGCIDCQGDNGIPGVPLCESCNSAHGKFKAFRSHNVVSIAEFRTRLMQTLKSKPKKCQKHPHRELELCCKQCHVSICQSCLLIEHNGHITEWLQEGTQKERSTLLELASSLDENMALAKTEHDAINSHVSLLESGRDTAHKNIDHEFNKLVSYLEFKRQSLHNAIEAETNLYFQSILARKEKLEFQWLNTLSGNQFAKRACSQASDLSLYESSQPIQEHLRHCQEALLLELKQITFGIKGATAGGERETSSSSSSSSTSTSFSSLFVPDISIHSQLAQSTSFDTSSLSTASSSSQKELENLNSLFDKLIYSEIHYGGEIEKKERGNSSTQSSSIQSSQMYSSSFNSPSSLSSQSQPTNQFQSYPQRPF